MNHADSCFVLSPDLLMSDRLHCSIFVCFVFFVVPNLRRSRLQPVSVRFRNLATLSSAAARWIFDLTWISRTVYAIVATWISLGSFYIFRAFRFAGSCDRGALRGPHSERLRLAAGDPHPGPLVGSMVALTPALSRKERELLVLL